jgi:hypothetical protein
MSAAASTTTESTRGKSGVSQVQQVEVGESPEAKPLPNSGDMQVRLICSSSKELYVHRDDHYR